MSPVKNDLVELNYGSSFVDIAKIIHISEDKNEVVVLDIIKKEKIILKKQDLYLKEDITGKSMCESYYNQMKMLGAQNIWVRLTKSQYKKIIKNKKECSEQIKEIDEKQIENLKKWFLDNKEEDKKEIFIDIFTLNKNKEIKDNPINIFRQKEESGPLSRFIKKNI
jgi:hypothetical protein